MTTTYIIALLIARDSSTEQLAGLWLQTEASTSQSETHSSEVWWHFSRCIIHGTHLFSPQSPTTTLHLYFAFCHFPSPRYNYSLQGPSIHCDRAPLWWSRLCLRSHSWTMVQRCRISTPFSFFWKPATFTMMPRSVVALHWHVFVYGGMKPLGWKDGGAEY